MYIKELVKHLNSTISLSGVFVISTTNPIVEFRDMSERE